MSRLYRDTDFVRRSLTQAKVLTLVGIDPGAPADSYRKVTLLGPAANCIFAIDTVTEEQIAQEVSAGAEIGEGLTAIEWPVVGTNVPWSIRLAPSQRLRGMVAPGAAITGIAHYAVIIEYRSA